MLIIFRCIPREKLIILEIYISLRRRDILSLSYMHHKCVTIFVRNFTSKGLRRRQLFSNFGNYGMLDRQSKGMGEKWHFTLIPSNHFPGDWAIKNLPELQETRVGSLGQEDPPEKVMAAHSSMVWEISRIEESDKLLSMGLQTVRHDLATIPPNHF